MLRTVALRALTVSSCLRTAWSKRVVVEIADDEPLTKLVYSLAVTLLVVGVVAFCAWRSGRQDMPRIHSARLSERAPSDVSEWIVVSDGEVDEAEDRQLPNDPPPQQLRSRVTGSGNNQQSQSVVSNAEARVVQSSARQETASVRRASPEVPSCSPPRGTCGPAADDTRLCLLNTRQCDELKRTTRSCVFTQCGPDRSRPTRMITGLGRDELGGIEGRFHQTTPAEVLTEQWHWDRRRQVLVRFETKPRKLLFDPTRCGLPYRLSLSDLIGDCGSRSSPQQSDN